MGAGAPVDRLAFIPNATTGVAIALASTNVGADDELLVTDHGYRAVGNQVHRLADARGARVVDGLASEARPVYAQVTRPARRQNQGSGASGGALLGVVAVPRPGNDGLKLSSVMSGTGAERAGLREGDVIVRFAGTAVDGLEELRTLIRERKAGDTVPVLYLRNGEAHSTSATLGPRTD